MTRRLGAFELLDLVLDTGSFTRWDGEPLDVHPEPAYAAELAAARERSGVDESVITGEGRLRGRRVAVLASGTLRPRIWSATSCALRGAVRT